MDTSTALVTGASQGLGRALATALSARGWRLVVDARDADRLAATVAGLPRPDLVTAVAGDVADAAHRAALAAAAGNRLDVLVNNASTLGPSPLPRLADLRADELERILRTNAVAPLALTQLLLPALRRASGRVLDISSDAAVEAYAGWGGYGASKAALEHISRTLAVELEGTGVRVEVVDPGEMATQMHSDAIGGGDVSHLPPPESVAPRIVALIEDALGEAA